jgi:2',3'-cyclic-nucleotide 2'-phosphodiesterase (5'-nucleotidase family)
LECRFSHIRREETNIANFYADLINYNAKSDFCIFNAGSLRIDEIIPEGIITLRELKKISPLYNPVIVLEGTGE